MQVLCLFCDKESLWISEKPAKRKKDALVQSVTRTAEISIKESVMIKGDERLKVHVENVNSLQEKPGIMNLAEKHIQGNLNAIFPNLLLKIIERISMKEKDTNMKKKNHIVKHLNTFVNMSKNTSLKKHMLLGYHT